MIPNILLFLFFEIIFPLTPYIDKWYNTKYEQFIVFI